MMRDSSVGEVKQRPIKVAWASSRSTRFALSAAVAALGLIVFLVGYSALRQIEEEIFLRSEVTAKATEEYLKRSLNSAESALRAIATWIKRHGGNNALKRQDLVSLAENLNIDTSATAAIAVIAPDGEATLLSKDYAGQTFNVSARPYFPIGQASKSNQFSYGPALINSNTGKATVAVMLKLEGQFQNYLLATAFAVEPLRSFLADMRVTDGGFVGVLGSGDQIGKRAIIAISPDSFAAHSNREIDKNLITSMADTWSNQSILGKKFSVLERKIADTPFSVFIGFAEPDIFALWIERNALTAALFLGAILSTVALVFLVLAKHGKGLIEQEMHSARQEEYIVDLGAEIEEHLRTENELRRSEARLVEAQRIAKIGSWELDWVTGVLYWSEEVFRIFQVDGSEFDGTTRLFYERVHPDDRDVVRQITDAAVSEGKTYSIEHRLLLPDGEERVVHELAEAIFDRDGNPTALRGTVRDITEVKAAEVERERLESQLRQAQKMEAVGQLTGGVAHDFNNILAIISGNLEMATDASSQAEARQYIALASRASDRAASLTHRLLAFSRQQPLSPKKVQAGNLLNAMGDLLRRTLGETIETEIVVDGGLWFAEVDPYQLENVILNLCINARDAMPDGGRLTIEAHNARLDDHYAAEAGDVPSGQYVCIAVTDTGKGMTQEVLEHAFDPFYTTKKLGEGTGLGLSMAQGFAIQSRGYIRIYSEVGDGTTVKIYLPRSDSDSPEWARSDGQDEIKATASAKVLIVEDDSDLRRLVAQQLEKLGHLAFVAENGPDAMALLAQHDDISLLLTDVILPGGLNGRALAEKCRSLKPDLRVIFMSGYTENAIIHHGRLDEGVILLQKPFRLSDLSRVVHRALPDLS